MTIIVFGGMRSRNGYRFTRERRALRAHLAWRTRGRQPHYELILVILRMLKFITIAPITHNNNKEYVTVPLWFGLIAVQ